LQFGKEIEPARQPQLLTEQRARACWESEDVALVCLCEYLVVATEAIENEADGGDRNSQFF
jgi:hypothetical protein